MQIRSLLVSAAVLFLAACGPVAEPTDPGSSGGNAEEQLPAGIDQPQGYIEPSNCCRSAGCMGGARCYDTYDAYGHPNGCYCGG